MTDSTQSTNDNHGVRDRASHAADRAREGANKAYADSKERAKSAAHRAEDGLEGNPLSVLVGGVAVGLLAGSLIPRTEREKEVLGPLGKRLAEGATAAFIAARDAGKEELESLAPDKDQAKSKASSALSHVVDAATKAGKSAASNAKAG
ncbi:DUF883 family protein [Stakelama pacifica]|uniref:Uncharacterized protein DUF883 n=1 Tax=Stakelama pacifica TaxID=517720 RepID=A0A4R6FXX0_9SPHN|nr:DUF883 family protein [Stakelama pacifica]TDN86647.1 uncharacterized protein DUF883 [Stakelama pacifica]GGO90266.1 hypothetical protein GCM10011329_02170 [Stakelama pacifica]